MSPWNKGKKLPQLGGENHYNWRGGEISKKCIFCGERFTHFPSQKQKFCSLKCFNHSRFVGRYKNINGYIFISKPDHPFAQQDGYILEHRFIMEQKLGRYLKPTEQVHHKNAVKDDNRIENLILISVPPHYGEISCPYCNKNFLIH